MSSAWPRSASSLYFGMTLVMTSAWASNSGVLSFSAKSRSLRLSSERRGSESTHTGSHHARLNHTWRSRISWVLNCWSSDREASSR